MNKLFILCFIVLLGCSDPSPNCFKKSGAIVSQIVDVSEFRTVTVHDNVSIILENGTQQVTVSAGSNLISRVNVSVDDQRLTINDNNVCNWTRDYGKVTINIRHPNLEEVKLLGSGTLSSLDTLFVDNFSIISRDSPSDVYLTLKGNALSISTNNVSNFELSGYLENLKIGFFYGDGILNAQNLIVNRFDIDHRGTNAMHIHAVESLTGIIQGAGDAIIYYKPKEKDLNIIGPGKLIERY